MAPPSPLRRALPIALVLLALLAVACSDDTDDTAAPPGTDATGAADDAGTRQVTDIHGPVTVPADPQRVVVMEDQTLGNLHALGFPMERIVGYPLGIGGSFENSPELADIDPTQFTSIGDFAEPNLEAIAKLDPDLIVTVGLIGDEFYDEQWAKLTSIGVPVFVVSNGYRSFDQAMTMLADTGRAVNLEQEAATVEAALRARVDELTAAVAATDLPDTGYVRLSRADQSLYVESSPWLTLLGVPGPRPTPEQYAVSYADELMADALGGYEVLFVADRVAEPEFLARLEGNPLWPGLPAVQNDHVIVVSENTWKAYSVPAISWILDDIDRELLG
jgi:iron complex transport system substrate-binding protein